MTASQNRPGGGSGTAARIGQLFQTAGHRSPRQEHVSGDEIIRKSESVGALGPVPTLVSGPALNISFRSGKR